ncbi:hypothetical protein NQZ68_000121 [Dissostichus eleginoides]|nr:hypothetical protein NQZ68_000121 [Dissostichus eleginoides]
MQVARMIVVMVLAFLVTWLPYAGMALAVIMDSSLYINPIIATIPVYLAKSSTVYNPMIYIFMNRQFRGYAVPTILCGRNPWATESQVTEDETTVSTLNKLPRVSPKHSLKE